MRALSRYLAKRPHDPDFEAFGLLPGGGLFLDVGASIGQSALSFRIYNRESPILSLEPLPGHRDDLRFVRRVIKDHDFMMVGAAESSRNATLYVPVLGRYELPAESSLSEEDARAVLTRLQRQGTDPKRLWLKEVAVDLRRLDELGVDPSFVKVDVEGAELGVLRGLRETIAKSRPALMIERSERFAQAAALLAGEGYEPFAYREGRFAAYRGEETVNVFLLPKETAAAVTDARDRRSG